MRDIGVRAGVAQSTVSRALKDDPRISDAQRRRIQTIARLMGYHPNPLVSALMAGRRTSRVRSELDTIAFITDYASPRQWAVKPTCVEAYSAMERRAGERGYKIECFCLKEYESSPGAIERVLLARGIRGVLFGFSKEAGKQLQFNLSGFATAGLGSYFPTALVDRVQIHGFHNVRLGLGRLRELGYRRTGLVVPRYNNTLIENAWSGAYLDDQWSRPKTRRLEPFLPDSSVPDPSEFQRWIDRQRPDSLLVYKVDVLGLLAKLNRQVPQDIGVAFLYRTEAEKKAAAGVDECLAQLGAAAIDLVVEKLNSNRFGVELPIRELFVKGLWRNGPTVTRVSRLGNQVPDASIRI